MHAERGCGHFLGVNHAAPYPSTFNKTNSLNGKTVNGIAKSFYMMHYCGSIAFLSRRLQVLLSDSKIRELISSGVLTETRSENLGPVSYDLTTRAFHTRERQSLEKVTLSPGDSTYVSTVEVIKLPKNIAARVLLRNSRIRQGLSLDAPLYFPGHHTRVFFRVTNMSSDQITLSTSDGIAQLVFETVEGNVEHPYKGIFSDELDYRGLGGYKDIYANEIEMIDKKTDEVRDIEKHMYANVLALMAIFAAIFTLVNVNVVAAGKCLSQVLVLNLTTVGSFGALVALITAVVKPKERWARITPWIVAVAAFAVAILVAIFL